MAIADLRKDYRKDHLDRADLLADPLAQFQRWFDQAAGAHGGRVRQFAIAAYKAVNALLGKRRNVEANAMALATVDENGQPAVRMVLLKGVDARGFIFFSNYRSRKGRDLEVHPRAALTFYWNDLERQVCVSGPVTKLPAEESAAYFHSRPRGSQIAAWASDQSQPIVDRSVLETRVKELQAQYAGGDIPLPPHWGGYILEPRRIEFWQGRASRLHDRFCYSKTADGAWQIERLAP